MPKRTNANKMTQINLGRERLCIPNMWDRCDKKEYSYVTPMNYS